MKFHVTIRYTLRSRNRSGHQAIVEAPSKQVAGEKVKDWVDKRRARDIIRYDEITVTQVGDDAPLTEVEKVAAQVLRAHRLSARPPLPIP